MFRGKRNKKWEFENFSVIMTRFRVKLGVLPWVLKTFDSCFANTLLALSVFVTPHEFTGFGSGGELVFGVSVSW